METSSLFEIGYFDPHGRLARNGRNHAHADGLEGHRKVVGKVDDPADLDSRSGSVFVHRYYRPGIDTHHLSLDAEIGQLFFENGAVLFEPLPVGFGGFRFIGVEQA